MLLVLLALGALAIFIGAQWIYNAAFSIERRTARWRREYEAALRIEPLPALRDRIAKSDYWDLTAKSSLRDADTVKDFFRRFDAEQYDQILTELDDGNYMCSVFAAAERQIGYAARPMIMDYDDLFIPVLKELRKRKSSSAH
jgi:hypothetical protein